MSDSDDVLRFSRRRALKGASLFGAAVVVGCEPGGDTPPPDASILPPTDGGADAGREYRDAGPPPTGPFRHGVASGDPLPDAVILWTRVTSEGSDPVELAWEMSTEPSFASIAATGTVMAEPARDFTAKLDATGLEPATTYYYRFRMTATDELSPIGRTRTAPDPSAAVERLRFAVCACSNHAFGYFHAYRNIAARAELDAVLHLGDYIYEYGAGQYGSFREPDPPHEILTLEDYRRRYAHYRSDPDLQEVHRQHPFVTVWDDHETANDAYRDGAGNHQPEEGSFPARKAAAQQAYDEWMPIRTAEAAEGGPAKIWRSLRYGTLAELIMLDTRLEGRDAQGQGADDERSLISEEQENWLIERLTTSEAQWKLIGQQVMFSPLPLVRNADQWDGYPAARTRVMEALRSGGEGGGAIEDVVVLTGDIHTAWAIEAVEDPAVVPLPPAAAVEFVAAGVASPPLTPPGTTLERALQRRLPMEAPHIKHADISHRGYFVLDVTPARAHATFVQMVDVQAPYDPSEVEAAAFETASGESRLVEVEPAVPPSGAPALAP